GHPAGPRAQQQQPLGAGAELRAGGEVLREGSDPALPLNASGNVIWYVRIPHPPLCIPLAAANIATYAEKRGTPPPRFVPRNPGVTPFVPWNEMERWNESGSGSHPLPSPLFGQSQHCQPSAHGNVAFPGNLTVRFRTVTWRTARVGRQ